MSAGTTAAIFVLLMVSSCLAALKHVDCENFNYDENSSSGPGNWSVHCETCGLSSQSPINFATVTHTSQFSGLTLHGYDNLPTSNFNLSNNGHTAKIHPVNDDKSIYIDGGGLQNKYILEEVDFHWGSSDTAGSEHRVSGWSSPLEVHLTHYNEKYQSVADAESHGDATGVAVLGVFVSIDNDASKESAAFGKIVNGLPNVPNQGDETNFEPFVLSSLLPTTIDTFYRYNGSLTTPACSEIVVWSVFQDPVYITSAHLAVFRTLRDPDGALLTRNTRPVQALNSRRAYHQMPGMDGGSGGGGDSDAGRLVGSFQTLAALVLLNLFLVFFVNVS